MGIIVGRLTGREMDGKAGFFMETAAGWPDSQLALAQELITAFMRLSSYRPKDALGSATTNESTSDPISAGDTLESDDPANDPMPV
jgi:hypothetical protein